MLPLTTKTANKSKHLEISPDVAIEGLAGLNDTSSKYKVIIIDDMALVNAIPKTERIKTCKYFAQAFLDQLSNMADEYDEVRLVFDRYQLHSQRTNEKKTDKGEINIITMSRTLP